MLRLSIFFSLLYTAQLFPPLAFFTLFAAISGLCSLHEFKQTFQNFFFPKVMLGLFLLSETFFARVFLFVHVEAFPISNQARESPLCVLYWLLSSYVPPAPSSPPPQPALVTWSGNYNPPRLFSFRPLLFQDLLNLTFRPLLPKTSSYSPPPYSRPSRCLPPRFLKTLPGRFLKEFGLSSPFLTFFLFFCFYVVHGVLYVALCLGFFFPRLCHGGFCSFPGHYGQKTNHTNPLC